MVYGSWDMIWVCMLKKENYSKFLIGTEAKICPLSDMLTIVIEIWFYTIFFSRVATKFAGYTIEAGKTGERQKKKKWADNILLIYFHLYVQRSFKKPHKDILRIRKGVFRRFYLFLGCFLLRCKCIWGRKYLQSGI